MADSSLALFTGPSPLDVSTHIHQTNRKTEQTNRKAEDQSNRRFLLIGFARETKPVASFLRPGTWRIRVLSDPELDPEQRVKVIVFDEFGGIETGQGDAYDGEQIDVTEPGH